MLGGTLEDVFFSSNQRRNSRSLEDVDVFLVVFFQGAVCFKAKNPVKTVFRCKYANFLCKPSDRERTHRIRGGLAPQPLNRTLQNIPCFFSHSDRKSFASLFLIPDLFVFSNSKGNAAGILLDDEVSTDAQTLSRTPAPNFTVLSLMRFASVPITQGGGQRTAALRHAVATRQPANGSSPLVLQLNVRSYCSSMRCAPLLASQLGLSLALHSKRQTIAVPSSIPLFCRIRCKHCVDLT